MLKRTLVCTAVLAALSAPVHASYVTIDGGNHDISYEGTAGLDSIELPELTVNIDSNFLNNDTIVLTFDTPLASDLEAGELNVDLSDFLSGLEIASITENEIVLKVVSEGDAQTSGDTILISGIRIDSASIRSVAPNVDGERPISIVTKSLRGTSVIESGEDAVDELYVSNEFKAGNNTYNMMYIGTDGELLDVNQENDFGEDSLAIALDGDQFNEPESYGVNVTTVTHVLTGDFSFIDFDEDGEGHDLRAYHNCSSGIPGGLDASSVTVTPTTITVVSAAEADVEAFCDFAENDDYADLVLDFSLYAASSELAQAGTWDLETTWSYEFGDEGEGEVAFINDDVVGLAHLGKTVAVRSMPFGDNIDPFLWVSNDSPVDAEATFYIVHDGETYGPFNGGVVAAKSNSRLADELTAAAAASGIESGRGDVIITLSHADADIPFLGEDLDSDLEGTPWEGGYISYSGMNWDLTSDAFGSSNTFSFGEDQDAILSGTAGAQTVSQGSQSLTGSVNMSNLGGTVDLAPTFEVTRSLEFNVYAGYKVVSADDRLELPVDVLSNLGPDNGNFGPL